MGKNALEGTDFVCVSDLLDDLGNFVVLVSRLDQSDGGLGGFVGSEDDISFLAGDGGIFVGLDDDCVASEGSESVDMDSEFNFDEVSFFDAGGILLEGRVVSADLVDGEGGGEGESLEDGFFIINFGEFLVDEAVAPQAELEDLASDGDLFEEFGENL